jgi:hypothetical protein
VRMTYPWPMELCFPGGIRRPAWLLASLVSITLACAGAPPEDGITTNPDARHDTRSDGASPGEDTRPSATDTAVPREDTAVREDTATAPDTAVEDTSDTAPLTCALDEWDLDGLESNGCEFKDTAGNHTLSTAYAFGDVDECDSSYGWKTHSGSIASDDRLHGSAKESGLLGRPQYITAKHIAKTFCVDDPVYQLSITGGTGAYRVSIYRHGDLSELDTKCSPHEVGGKETSADFACTGQDDGELAIIKIEKVSGPREKVSYTLKYHN